MCPSAVDDSFDFVSGQRRNLHVLENDLVQLGEDLDEDSLEILDGPEHGDPAYFWVHRDYVHYRAEDGFVGLDSFTYRICNTAGLCDVATVSINVLVNTALPDLCTGYTESTIRFSFDFDRRDSRPLNGVGLLGPDSKLYVFATTRDSTTSVAFYINDRDRLEPPQSVESRCVFDLLATRSDGLPVAGVTLSDLGVGFHTITIVVKDEDGSVEVRHAIFAILMLTR